MDPLSDVFRVVRLNGAFFYLVEAAAPWSVAAVAARDLAPRILPEAEHLISYHIVTGGSCWAGVKGEPQRRLVAGDVIVFPHGDPHVMSSQQDRRIAGDDFDAAPARYPGTVTVGGAGDRDTTFVCSFLGCDARPFNPLIAALPRLLHAPGGAGGWLAEFPRQAVAESQLGRIGADTMLTRMAELMFIEVLRRYLADLSPGHSGWLAGLRDETVGHALSLLHGSPERDWTLANLAREVASSRSNLARRFTELVGQPPMQYLANWRMQVAANLLARRNDKVASIAAEVGYDSEAAFSRAFKKATGLAPGAWRAARGSVARFISAA